MSLDCRTWWLSNAFPTILFWVRNNTSAVKHTTILHRRSECVSVQTQQEGIEERENARRLRTWERDDLNFRASGGGGGALQEVIGKQLRVQNFHPSTAARFARRAPKGLRAPSHWPTKFPVRSIFQPTGQILFSQIWFSKKKKKKKWFLIDVTVGAVGVTSSSGTTNNAYPMNGSHNFFFIIFFDLNPSTASSEDLGQCIIEK